MLIEVICAGQCYYWLADFPEQGILDIKCMMVEKHNPDAKTPADLLRMLSNVKPCSDLLQPQYWHEDRRPSATRQPLPLTFRFAADVFEDMDRWVWMDLFKLGKRGT